MFHDSEFESSSRGFEILRAKGMKRKSGDSNIRKNLGISFPGKNGFPKADREKWRIFPEFLRRRRAWKGGDKIVMYSPVIHRQSPKEIKLSTRRERKGGGRE